MNIEEEIINEGSERISLFFGGEIRLCMTKPNNMFIFVTNNGSVFDRTGGKNVRMFPNQRYLTGKGSIEFVKEDGKILIRRFSCENKLSYIKDITTPGMYIVTPLFTQGMAKTSKEVRILYNKLRSVFSKPLFKIIEEKNLDQPFKIRLSLRIEKGISETKFDIFVNPDELSPNIIDDVFHLMEKALNVNFHIVLRNFHYQNQSAIKMFIDEEFINTAKIMEKIFTGRKIVNS